MCVYVAWELGFTWHLMYSLSFGQVGPALTLEDRGDNDHDKGIRLQELMGKWPMLQSSR